MLQGWQGGGETSGSSPRCGPWGWGWFCCRDLPASASLGAEGLKVTKHMNLFPPWTVTFAFWQRVGHGPAMGHGLWGAMHPPPGNGPGRSACSFTDTTSAEGPSSPHAGSSQLPTASTSKSLNHLARGVPLALLAAGLYGGPLQWRANALWFLFKMNWRRDRVILISWACSITFKPSLSLLAWVQVFTEKKVSPRSDPNQGPQFSDNLGTPSFLGKQLKIFKHQILGIPICNFCTLCVS